MGLATSRNAASRVESQVTRATAEWGLTTAVIIAMVFSLFPPALHEAPTANALSDPLPGSLPPPSPPHSAPLEVVSENKST